MNYLCIVKVDVNDGDYETTTYEVTAQNAVEILELFNKIKNLVKLPSSKSYNDTPIKMYGVDVDFIEAVEAVCPCSGHGFHTIESISFYPLAGDKETVDIRTRWNQY